MVRKEKQNQTIIGFVMHHLFYAKRNIIKLERTHPKMKDVYLYLNQNYIIIIILIEV